MAASPLRAFSESVVWAKSILIWNLKGDIRPYLEKGVRWSEGSNPKYIEAQRNRLDIRMLQLQSGTPEGLLNGCNALIQDCLAVEKQFRAPLPYQSGAAFRLKTKAQIQAECTSTDQRPPLLQKAKGLWEKALEGNRHLNVRPDIQTTLS